MSLDLSLIFSEFNFKMTKSTNQKIYEFEEFRLDAVHLLLYRNGEEISLAPKVIETLLALVENRGKVLSTDELMEKIWTDSIVEENNLSQNLFRLRKILGNTKDGKPFIETLRRRGYRFVPKVSIASEERAAPESFGESKTAKPPIQTNHHLTVERRGNVLAVADWQSETETAATAENLLYLVPPAQKSDAPTPQKNGSRFIFAAIGLLFIVFVTVSFFSRFSGGVNAWSPDKIKIKRLTESGNLFGAAISPDGNSLAYVVRDGKNSSLRLKNIQTESELIIVPPTENPLGSPRFSPDGNFVYYSHREGVSQIPIFGGDPRLIAANLWSEFAVSPDGRQIAFPRANSTENKSFIVVAETDGSGERIVAARTDPDFYAGWGPAPVFSPDGKNLTAVTGRHGSGEMRVVEVNLQTGDERELKMQAAWEGIEYVNWATQEELLISAQKKGEDKIQIWSVKFPGGTVERVTNDFNDYLHFNFSKDTSKIVALQEVENVHLWLFDKETGAARQLTSGISRADGLYGLAFAPDGNSIIYTARDKKSYDIFSLKTDGSDLRQLTKNAGRRNFMAVISPDNQFIAFVSDRTTGEPRLWLMNTDGTAARQLTAPDENKENSEESPYFSPDGKWIYYVFYQAGKGSIRKIPIEGGESVAISQTDKNVFEPVASPDGKFLAHAVYNDEAKSPWQVAVMSLENPSEKERFFNFPAERLRVRWTSDSNSVVSIDDQLGSINLWQTNLTSGERKQMTNFTTDKIYRFDVSPDGHFTVVSRGIYFYDAVLIER